MLGTNIIMIQRPGLLHRELQNFLGSGGEWNIPDDQGIWTAGQVFFQFLFQLSHIHTAFLNDGNSYAPTILNNALQNMFCA